MTKLHPMDLLEKPSLPWQRRQEMYFYLWCTCHSFNLSSCFLPLEAEHTLVSAWAYTLHLSTDTDISPQCLRGTIIIGSPNLPSIGALDINSIVVLEWKKIQDKNILQWTWHPHTHKWTYNILYMAEDAESRKNGKEGDTLIALISSTYISLFRLTNTKWVRLLPEIWSFIASLKKNNMRV